MKLEDVLGPYKYFGLAKSTENQDILDFFKSMTMDTPSLSLRYERGEDFFSYFNDQCERAYVFTMKNEDGSIKGLGSIALIRHFINGESELCAYLGDLRISPKLSAKIRVKWKKCYGDIISQFHELEEFKDVRYLYSAILDDNFAAMKSLLKNNERIIYHPLTSYETISIYGNNPLMLTNPRGLKIANSNFEDIRHLLQSELTTDGLHYDFSNGEQNELDRRLETWKGLDKDSFMSVTRSNGEVVATCAPWMSDTKKLIVTKIGSFYRMLGSLLFPLFGIPKLTPGKEVKMLYLTHLHFKRDLSKEERRAALVLMIRKILKHRRAEFHLISFFSYPCWQIDSLPFLYQSTKATLYQVMSKEQFERKDFIKLGNKAPAFTLEVS